MQIRRSSHLFFLFSAVIFCSMAVALVAAAPTPASAISNGLEQHPAGGFLKRMDPKEITLVGLTEQQLEALHEAKNLRLADIKESISQFKASPGNFGKATEALREERRIVKAHLRKIAAELDNIEVDAPFDSD